MEIMRTANAGVLLRLDNASILLDGVCQEVSPYLATPLWVKEQMLTQLPDAVCYTHCHKDHFDRDYARKYTALTGRAILGPEGVGTQSACCVQGVQISGIATRHIGAANAMIEHRSYVIQGTRCVWFLGDASPLQWRGKEDLPKPDVILAPYAYFATEKGWQCLQSFGASENVLLHMPLRENDALGLWEAVDANVGPAYIHCPELGETIVI